MNPPIRDWKGRRVWLVGASDGIGAALARSLTARGARLALSARRADALVALGLGDALLVPCDVTQPSTLHAAADNVRQTWGGLDLAVYLAGTYTPMDATSLDVDRANQTLAVNFTGALHLTHCVLPSLVPGAGLAFVASVAGYRGLPRALCYGPSKAALIHFAECLHLELAPRGIGVWVFNPGFVATRLTARNDFNMPALITPAEAAEAIVSGFAKGRFEIHFPRRFTGVLKALSLLPYSLYFPLVRRFTGGSSAAR